MAMSETSRGASAARQEHTSLPWSVQIEEYDPNCGTITIPEIHRELHDSDWAKEEEWERDLANAEFIVCACNSHKALLAALKECREVAAACFRVMAEMGLVDEILKQLPDGLVECTEGFGARAGDAIKAAESR
jgi:hypothetical protein